MDTDVVPRVDKLETEVERLKEIIASRTLHEYVVNEIRSVKPKNKSEIDSRLRRYESVKKSTSSKVIVEDPQKILDEIRINDALF
jgi:hypothetical protein